MAALELSRRHLIGALLGAPLIGCLPKRASYEVSIAGANDRLGHLFRDGFDKAPESESRVPVLIVGGGIAGLSAGWRLLRAGFKEFRILELDDAPGGTARMGENEISRHPWGAHYLPMPLPHAKAALALLSEMNVDETAIVRAPQERLFAGGRWSEGLWPAAGATAEDRRQLESFNGEMNRWADARDSRGRRAFAVPIHYGSDDAEVSALDKISMADWLDQRRYTSKRLRWYVEYATRDDFGARLEDVSAWAGIHYFASRQEKGKPAQLLTWPEGNGRIVSWLAQQCGDRLQPRTAVLKIVPKEQGAEVLAYRDGRVEKIVAGQVIAALPQSFLQRALQNFRRDYSRLLSVSAWLVVNLSLRAQPRSNGFPLAWDNVLYDSKSLGYVAAAHQLDPGGCAPAPGDPCSRRAPVDRGANVWTWYYPFTQKDGRALLYSMDARACADLAITDLKRAHSDLERCLTRAVAWRWGHAMARPSPGLVFSKERAEAARPLGDVHFAHTDLSALPLFEEAQFHGVRAAEEILQKRNISFVSLV